MNSVTKEILRKKLRESTRHLRNPRKIREYYWNCINRNNQNIIIPEEVLPQVEYDYSEFNEPNEYSGEYSEYSGEYSQPIITFLESQQFTLSRGNNRTFIDYLDSEGISNSKKLAKLNTWTNSSSEEYSFQKTVEVIDSVIREMRPSDNETLFKNAVNNYYNIKEYYSLNEYRLKSNSGSVRRGYLVLCIFMAFKSLGIPKKINEIIPYIPNARLSDIPEAYKGFVKIFGIIQESTESFCGFPFTPESLNEINGYYKILLDNKVIRGNDSEKAGLIYYYYKNNNQKITYAEILKYCQNTSSASIGKYSKVISNFFISFQEYS